MRLRHFAALPLLALLGACGLQGTNDGGYIAGDGQVVQFHAGDRGKPVELSGKTLEGKTYDVARDRGKAVVINVWGTWCAECIKETPIVQAAHEQLGDGVAFVGIDSRDTSTQTALAFQRGNSVTYPSIYSPDGRAVGTLADYVSPRTTPATIVLDRQGRVAAVIRGAIPSKLTLVEVVQQAAKS
jgi:thiol-disulfide isomerase/thioredoxin